MKIVRYIMIYMYDTFNWQQNQENQVNSSPTTDLRFLPNNGPPTASLAWLPGLRVRALLVLLAMLGLWPLDQLIYVFRYGPFKWSDWGGTFQYDLMALGGDEWRDELLQFEMWKNWHLQRSPYMTQQQLQVDFQVFSFYFLAFMFKGVKWHVKHLSYWQKGRKVFE